MKINGYEFGLRGHDIANNFSDMCKKASENNITNLQFALAKTVTDVNFDEVGYSTELAQKIKQELDNHGLTVSVLACYINPIDANVASRERQLTRFANFISYAKAFDATVIGTETGVLVKPDNPHVVDVERTHSEEIYQLFLSSLKPLVKKAEQEGVTIAIEPVALCPIRSAKVMKRLLEDVNSDNLEVILDFSNIITTENYTTQTEMIDEAFDLLGDKIRVIHLKDFNVKDGVKAFAPAGTGLLEIKHIFDRCSKLSKKPEIILDESKLAIYPEAVERLEKII